MLAGRSRRSLVNLNNGNKPFIGRRTGKVIDIKARLDKFGFERVSDYFPDTDSESDDEILHNPSINDENIDSSKLNKSKHNASSRSTEQNKSRNEPESERSQNKSEISPDSAVGSTDSEIPDANEVEHVSPQEKLVCLPDKKVRSPEKPVSSPEKQVSSPEKPVSSPEKQVSSPEKQVSSPEQLVTLPDKPASPSNKQVLSTVKRDRAIPQANISGFSITASSSEEEDMNPESTKKKLRFSLCNTSFVREELRSDIEQCLITSNGVNEPSEDDYVITDSARNARTKTLTTTVKNAKQKRKSQESSEDIEEQLTQKICKSDKFLTLKKRPNNTIREMLYRSKNHSKITIPPESPQLSSNNAAVSTSPQPSPKDETVRSQKCDENENKVSTIAPTTQKANRSKIPVRRKKTAKPTFQLRSSRKSSPKTQRYRKTPAAKSGARKTGDAEPEHTDERDERGIDLDSGDASDAGTSTLQAANSSKKSTTNEKLSNTRPESQTIKTSLGKRSTRSTKQQEFIQIEVTDSEESDDTPKEITTKIPRSKKNARVSDLTESSNVEVAGLQSKSPDKSASMHDSSASRRVQSLVNSVEESGSFRRSSRKRTGLSNQNELECGVNFESTVKTPISSRSKASTTKNTDTNSERSSRNSSEDESTASGVEVFHNTTEGPESTINSEDEGGESTIKAPRHRKKRVLKLDSATATINMEVDDNVGVGLRRSKRNRVPCLQYWKNDRIEYERRQSGFVVKDIIVNPTPAPTRRRRGFYGQPIKSQSKKATGDRNSTEDESDWSDIEMPDGMTKQTDPVATVVDLDTKHEVEMKLFHSGKNLDLRSPTSTQDESSTIDAPLLLDKYFTQGKFGAGEILLRPGAEKGMQHVRRDTMIFRLLSGRVLFSVHNQSFVASKGSTFFVPQGNIYNLKNLDSKKDARLSFYQIKE